MTRQRTVVGLLAVVAVLLALNLIVSGSPRASAQEPEIRIFPEPPPPKVVAGAVVNPFTSRTQVYRFWSDGAIDMTPVNFVQDDCVISGASLPLCTVEILP